MTLARIIAFTILLSSVSGQIDAKDLPPNVRIVTIGNEYVTFDVSGSNTVDGIPVKSIYVNYTQDNNDSNHNINGSMNLASVSEHPVSFSASNSSTFDRKVNVTGLQPGVVYRFEIYASNLRNQRGPSTIVRTLLKPQTPDFSITHRGADSLRLFWGYPDEKQIDYFLLTIEKKSAPGCGYTLNFTRCFGNSYSLANFDAGETYMFKFVSHNLSGDSEPVIVYFPFD